MEEIGKTLPAVFKRHVRGSNPQLVEILAPLWSRVAGKGIAEHSRPVAFWSGTLTLSTPCPTWAAQLRQLAGEIVAAVNAFLGGVVVKKLEVRFAAELVLPENETRNSKMEIRAKDEIRIPGIDTAGALDAETAGVLERSYGKYFRRGVKRLD